MGQTIRIFMLFEAATFSAAALIHSGMLVAGYEHHKARIAEGVITIVLLAAVASTWVRPAWTRRAGLAARLFALVGTLIGVFTIIVGVGPRTLPDIAYHAAIVAVLVWAWVCSMPLGLRSWRGFMGWAWGSLGEGAGVKRRPTYPHTRPAALWTNDRGLRHTVSCVLPCS